MAALRRKALQIARQLGIGEEPRSRLALVSTEMATNLIHHAGGGAVILNLLRSSGGRGLEILALDRGPGIDNPARALAGGSSTRGGLGEGLGAIRRLSDEFDLHTSSEHGTALLARFWTSPPRHPDPFLQLGVICCAKTGETVSGDGWTIRQISAGRFLMMMVDGLGHGPDAALVADKSREVFESEAEVPDTRTLIGVLHRELRPTRGAAVMVLYIDCIAGGVKVTSVGNLQGVILHQDGRRGLTGLNGTVGFGEIKIQEFSYDYPPDSLLIVHTDGLKFGWDLSSYRGLTSRMPSLIAGVLYRDYHRDDDATVAVIRRLC